MAGTEHYLNDMRATTLEYARKWNIVASRMALAYSAAYERQQKVLNGIKKTIEAQKKQQEAMMAFMLGLLTGGIVGPMADRLVKPFSKDGELSAIKGAIGKVSKDSLLMEWTGNVFKELVKLGDEKLRGVVVDALKPAEPSGFEPAGATPHDYTESLRLGIDQRADAMSDIARMIHRDHSHIEPGRARAVNEKFLSSEFFTKLPRESELKEADLKRSAELMLWIAWGKLRDFKYWNEQKAYVHHRTSEMFEWKPLLPELSRLGVPVKQMTMRYSPFIVYVPTQVTDLLDMPAFIAWAKGATAPAAAFANIPTNADGVKQSIDRLLKETLSKTN